MSSLSARLLAVYLLRLTGPMTRGRMILSSNVEGYVLSGTLRLSDPYHGVHELGPGFYFRIPRGFRSGSPRADGGATMGFGILPRSSRRRDR